MKLLLSHPRLYNIYAFILDKLTESAQQINTEKRRVFMFKKNLRLGKKKKKRFNTFFQTVTIYLTVLEKNDTKKKYI